MIDFDSSKSKKRKIRNETNPINIIQNTKFDSENRTISQIKNSKSRSKSADLFSNHKNKIKITSGRNSSRKSRIFSVDLRREIDDPANDGVRDEIERIIHFYRQIEQLKNDFNVIEK